MSCSVCELAIDLESTGSLIHLNGEWSANVRVDPNLRPAIVLQARQHATSWEDLSHAALSSLGQAIAQVSRGLSSDVVDRVYVMSFNETGDGHIHLHVVPRFSNEALLGPSLQAQASPPEGFDIGAALRRAGAASTAAPAGALARDLRVVCKVWNAKFSAYRLARWLKKRMPESRWDAAEIYVLAWLIALAAIFAATSSGRDPAWVAMAVVAYRLLDICLYALALLLKTEKSPLSSYGRSLVLALLNLGEVMFGVGAVVASQHVRPIESFDTGWHIALMQAQLAPKLGWVPNMILGMGTFAALLTLVGVLALVIGKIGDSFYSTSGE